MFCLVFNRHTLEFGYLFLKTLMIVDGFGFQGRCSLAIFVCTFLDAIYSTTSRHTATKDSGFLISW